MHAYPGWKGVVIRTSAFTMIKIDNISGHKNNTHVNDVFLEVAVRSLLTARNLFTLDMAET